MIELQQWFSPLLWFIATASVLIGVIKVSVKTVKRVFDTFETINKGLEELKTCSQSFQDDLDYLRERARKGDEVDKILIRDIIVKAYYECIESNFIEDLAYSNLCSLHSMYEDLGGNSYVSTLMEQIRIIHQRCHLEDKQ